MAKFDPFVSVPDQNQTPPQPQYIVKAISRNRPSIAPDTQILLEADIRRYRRNSGIPRVDLPNSLGTPVQGGTVAAIRTDIPGLNGRAFGGASPEAVPDNFRDKPGTKGGVILVPANPIAANHAEHVALENLRMAIECEIADGRLKRRQLDGCRIIMRVEQEPCSSCAAGLTGASASGQAGVIKQFSLLYPTAVVEVRSSRTSRSYILRAGNEV